jgi:hypothetical protein
MYPMNSRFLLSFVFCTILVFSVFFVTTRPDTVHAQVGVPTTELILSTSVDNPIPKQKVTVTLRSYSLDINTARVSWYVNGVQIQTGVGLTSLEVTAPSLGKKTSVRVTATTPEGRSSTETLDIGSGSIDLIIETDGYVPPLFHGKITPVFQNTVKIIAIPHIANSAGIEYDPKNLVYRWKKDDKVIEDQSGYGKQAVTVSSGIVPRAFNVSVDVYPRDGSAHAQNITGISFNSPSIGFYMSDPLYGPLLNHALESIVRIGSQKETSVLAVPFGFNKPASGVGNLTYGWSINNKLRNELSTNESLILRAPEGAAGSSDIELTIRNPDKILQGADGSFSAKFNASKKAGEDVVF